MELHPVEVGSTSESTSVASTAACHLQSNATEADCTSTLLGAMNHAAPTRGVFGSPIDPHDELLRHSHVKAGASLTNDVMTSPIALLDGSFASHGSKPHKCVCHGDFRIPGTAGDGCSCSQQLALSREVIQGPDPVLTGYLPAINATKTSDLMRAFHLTGFLNLLMHYAAPVRNPQPWELAESSHSLHIIVTDTQDEKPRKMCCCPMRLEVLPNSGDDTPPLKGGGSLDDTWGKKFQSEMDQKYPNDPPGTRKRIAEAQGRNVYGEGKNLGRRDTKENTYFTFQVIGTPMWVYNDETDADCGFTQTKYTTRPDGVRRGPVNDATDSGVDPNKPAGTGNGIGRELEYGRRGYEDPVAADNRLPGIWTWVFIINYSRGSDKCPCDPYTDLTKIAVLIIDNSSTPATIDWFVI